MSKDCCESVKDLLLKVKIEPINYKNNVNISYKITKPVIPRIQ